MQQDCRLSVIPSTAMARYQDYQAKEIPVVTDGGATVRVMAGEARGAAGPIALRNPGLLLDVKLAPHAAFRQEVCADAQWLYRRELVVTGSGQARHSQSWG